MQILVELPPLNPQNGKLFRNSPVPELLASLACFGFVIGGGYALVQMWNDLPWPFWLVLGPIALISGPLMLLIACAMFGSFRSSLKPTNWYAFVDEEGVYLNLRSYKNAHFDENDKTIAHLTHAEIESVGKVNEKRVDRFGDSDRIQNTKTIALTLTGDTAELAEACQAERSRKAPTTKRFGIESSTKHHAVTVFVPEPGDVRIQWNADLFAALTAHTAVAPERNVDLDDKLKDQDVEQRIRQLALRGERMAAVELASKELGLDKKAAKEYVRDAA